MSMHSRHTLTLMVLIGSKGSILCVPHHFNLTLPPSLLPLSHPPLQTMIFNSVLTPTQTAPDQVKVHACGSLQPPAMSKTLIHFYFNDSK